MSTTTTTNEAAVRELVEGYVNAIRNHDIDGVLSAYAPDLIAFDVIPPLQNSGADHYAKIWERVFEIFEKPLPYELRDLQIVVGDEVAFSHSLAWNGGTMTGGRKMDLWLRWTVGYKKIDGEWRISHLHASVPADFQTGKAMTELKP
jgi:uncharacterized protein (TIGR02246 family)